MKAKHDLVKNFSKLFSSKEESEDIPEEEWKMYMDSANVCGVIPKKRAIKELLTQQFDVAESKLPSLNYNLEVIEGTDDKLKVYGRLTGTDTVDKENSARFSTEYMGLLLKLALHTQTESIILKLRLNYPLWMETDEMIMILAPRVDGE